MEISLRSTFLESKVARRIFLLFVLCALLPIAMLAFFSFGQVSRQLYRQNADRLRQTNKDVAMGVLQRLLLLETDLELIGRRLAGPDLDAGLEEEPVPGPMRERFRSLALVEAGTVRPILGTLPPAAGTPAPEQRQHLAAGGTVVLTGSGFAAPVSLTRRLSEGTRIVGEVDPVYLWSGGLQDTLPPFHELLVLDARGRALHSTLGAPPALPEVIRGAAASGEFRWEIDGEPFLAAFRTNPMGLRFATTDWTFVLNQLESDALAPIDQFRRIFPLVVLTSLWVVLLLSVSQIRRSLDPVARLREGTRRIASRDFASRVEVETGDEFEELARSFNSMATQLGRQFETLSAIAALDRAVLTARSMPEIAETLLTSMRRAVPCDAIAVTLVDPDNALRGELHVLEGIAPQVRLEATRWSHGELRHLLAHPAGMEIVDRPAPLCIGPVDRLGLRQLLVHPVPVEDELGAVVCVGNRTPRTYEPDDRATIERLTDQIAVALSNARLIRDLDAMNWGSLVALARAIDAKSPWTAGHSERVTEIAGRIGTAMELSSRELDRLRRGSLLHDIGKLAIPAEVLDKDSGLSDDEKQTMRHHVWRGAQILEPIPAHRDLIPIVLQHHEWWDGSGYPAGLREDGIDLGARIISVADVYDAITSARPYRAGASHDEAVDLIRARSGQQFDPEVVAAFDRLVETGEIAGLDAVAEPGGSHRH